METLKELAAQPENKTCADCGTSGTRMTEHGTWISANLGVFVCIDCAGIHRHLGSHVSLIQCLELDTWDDQQAETVVSKGGNKVANAQYTVEGAPSDILEQVKESWEVREAYIKAKYLHQPYVAPVKKNASQQPSGARLTAAGILRIKLNAGVDLVPGDINGKSDPYVVFKCGSQKAKSAVQNETLNPVWNETIMMNIPNFKTDKLEIECWDADAFGRDDLLGTSSLKLSELKPREEERKIFKLTPKGEIHCELEYTPLS